MVIIDGIHGSGYKWIFVGTVLILTVWFGYLNHAYAITYGEVNELRMQVGLPSLTGNDQIDFRMLARECNHGIRDSCVLARRLQDPPQQQRVPQYSRQHVQPIPFDLNNPLEGLPPQFIPHGSSSSSPSSGGSNPYGCQQNCQQGRSGCMSVCRNFWKPGCSDQCDSEYQSCMAGC